jgi:hypothetical protein
MKLIKIIQDNFKNYNHSISSFVPQVFTLTTDKLKEIKELKHCDEFSNVELRIVDKSEIGNNIETYKISDNGFTDRFSKKTGIFYLYQINTVDFKTFDIRGYFISEPIQRFYYGHNIDGLTSEQKDIVTKILRNIDTLFFSHDYIDNRIMDFNKENISIKENIFNNSEYISFDNGKFYLNKSDGSKENFFSGTQNVMSNIIKNFDEENIKENIKQPSYSTIADEMLILEKTIDECDGLDEEQIISIKEKIKTFESKLKDKIKPKTITISSLVHNKIKNYCNTFGLKIGDWVEETLLNALDCSDKKSTKKQTEEEWLEESKDELLKKWREYQKINKLIKTEYLILKPKFKFKGFSIVDHKPLYDYLGTDKELEKDLETIKCKIYLTIDKRELNNVTYLNKFADLPVEGIDVNLPEEEVDLENLTSERIKKLINALSGNHK